MENAPTPQTIKAVILDENRTVVNFMHDHEFEIVKNIPEGGTYRRFDYEASPIEVGWKYDPSTNQIIPKKLPIRNAKKIAILDQNNVVINIINENELAIDDVDYLDPNAIPVPTGYNQPGYSSVEFDYEGSPLRNLPQMGWTYDAAKQGFISPKPEVYYILNDLTWEIDSSQPYDLHGNGELYQYNSEGSVWDRVN